MGIFNSIAELLAGGQSFALALIVSRSGSAPRAAGARMVVREDSSIIGTIGGGILEAKVRDLAMEALRERKSMLKEFVFNADDAGWIGMICGGRVKVLVQFVDASQTQNLLLYREILATLRARKPAWLITEIPSGEAGLEPIAQWLVSNGAAYVGRPGDGTVEALTAGARAGRPQPIEHEDRSYLVESLRNEGVVYIFGAGHISRELASLTGLVGFQTVVLDDRPDFANRERFPDSDEVVVLDSFDRALAGLEINEDSYLVLVTRGHAHDKTLLRQALGTKAGYIGMIGSRTKRDSLYEALCREGFARDEFERVSSPIGLDIGAETPEEIAVSIVAELIRARAKRNR
ncbi:MAG: XdhC family aldehyde oxidoreductase maturation factor [Syntrophobacteraceae bacterium]